MFLLVHASVGAVVGEQIQSPLIAFFVGILSHFVLDIIPHGDEGVGRIFLQRKQYGWLGAMAVIDALAALCLVSLLWLYGLLPNYLSAYAGAVGAMIPDILAGFIMLSKKKFLPEFEWLHEWNHRLLGVKASFVIGGTVQLIMLVSAWLVALVAFAR